MERNPEKSCKKMTSDAKKILKIASLFFFSLIIIIYAFLRSSDLVFGVKIKNVNLTRDEKLVKITGNARNAVNLFLDGREISIDGEGNFSETIALLLGYNIVSLEAHDKFENHDYKSYQLIY